MKDIAISYREPNVRLVLGACSIGDVVKIFHEPGTVIAVVALHEGSHTKVYQLFPPRDGGGFAGPKLVSFGAGTPGLRVRLDVHVIELPNE